MTMTQQDYTNALFSIPTPSDYDTWLTISMAAKAAGVALMDWQRWNSRDAKYNGKETENTSIWTSIKPDGAIQAGTLIYFAKSYGYQPSAAPKAADAVNTEDDAQELIASYQQFVAASIRDQNRAIEYMQTRGIDEDTTKRFKVGFNLLNSAIVIPYPPNYDYYVERSVLIEPNAPADKGQRWNNPKGKKRIFNIPALQEPLIYIVEGQIDAISIEQAGGHSIATKEPAYLLDTLKNTKNAPICCVVPDNDEAGEKYAAKMIQALTDGHYMAIETRLPDNYHDANDMLCKAGTDGLAQWTAVNTQMVQGKVKEIRQTKLETYQAKAQTSADLFLATIRQGVKVTQTGFLSLDSIIGGGLSQGLVILGAKSSMGKTTFALQLADQIAGSANPDQRRDILYFSLEQDKTELLAKSISRNLYLRHNIVKSAMDIRTRYRYANQREKDAIEEEINNYTLAAGKSVYIVESRGEDITSSYIRGRVAEHYDCTGSAPIVIVDYLQLMTSDNPRCRDDYQIVSSVVKGLTAISRDYQTTVLAISSYNRASYNNDASMQSFSGSHKIEYSADLLLSLQPDYDAIGQAPKEFDEEAWKRQDIRQVAVKVLKNRNGITGLNISMQYKPKCDTFTEVDYMAKNAPN